MVDGDKFMKAREVATIIILAVAILIGFGSAVLTDLDDNIIEEASEEVIERTTGIGVDLTPDSEE